MADAYPPRGQRRGPHPPADPVLPAGDKPEFGPPGPRSPSTAQVIEWLQGGAFTLGAIAIWAAIAVLFRDRWLAGATLGGAVWCVVAVVNVYLHYDVPAGGVRWHYPPWWFWFTWLWSVRGSWLLELVLVIRSRLRARAGEVSQRPNRSHGQPTRW